MCTRRWLVNKIQEDDDELHLTSVEKDIHSRRKKLQSQIRAWRSDQKLLMPKAGDAIAQQSSCEVEHEKLFLPSQFSLSERKEMGIDMLGAEEAKLREGQAFDALLKIRTAVRTVTALMDQKQRDARGQAQNTRALRRVREAEAQRNVYIQMYASARDAMISLGVLDPEDSQCSFPLLTLADTFMKSPYHKRGLGDSRRTDGALWRKGGVAVGASASPVSQETIGPSCFCLLILSQCSYGYSS
jgi:hypothetical protein